jgi:hypothetical protein
MPSGGRRNPLGGRPKGHHTKWKQTLDREAAYALYREQVLAHMAEIVQAQVQAATGVYEVLAITSKGLVRVTDPAVLDRLLQSGEACYRICLKDPGHGDSALRHGPDYRKTQGAPGGLGSCSSHVHPDRSRASPGALKERMRD